jgi:hypothetical protein
MPHGSQSKQSVCASQITVSASQTKSYRNKHVSANTCSAEQAELDDGGVVAA